MKRFKSIPGWEKWIGVAPHMTDAELTEMCMDKWLNPNVHKMAFMISYARLKMQEVDALGYKVVYLNGEDINAPQPQLKAA